MRRLFLAILALTLLPNPAAAERVEREYHETFPVGPETFLELESGHGDIEIRAWDRPEVQIDVVYIADESHWGIGSGGEFAVDFEVIGDRIHVRERSRTGVQIGVRVSKNRRYEYTIHAPATLPLEIHGDDGDVVIPAWEADLDLRLDDGHLELAGLRAERLEIVMEDGAADLVDIQAELLFQGDDADLVLEDSRIEDGHIEMEDGTIRIRSTEGNLEVEVDDADVDFEDVAIRTLRIKAQDGDLSFDARDVSGMDWDIRSDDGDIHVDLGSGASLEFSIEADDGEVELDLANGRDVEHKRHWARGWIADGDGDLRIRTMDGGVRLRQRG